MEFFPSEAPLNQQEVDSLLPSFSPVEGFQPGMELRLPLRFRHANLRSGLGFLEMRLLPLARQLQPVSFLLVSVMSLF